MEPFLGEESDSGQNSLFSPFSSNSRLLTVAGMVFNYVPLEAA